MKRIVLFLVTNLAVMLLLSVVLNVLGLNRFLAAEGIDYQMLLGFALVVGFGGSFFSLLISKPVAKWSTGAHVIDGSEGSTEYWLVNSVHRLADSAGIGRPEVAIFEGAPNAFATGAFKNDALVAVSTELLQSMSREEVEAVLGHEVAHVANGDMVTMALIQGVMNTFVIFASRALSFAIDNVLSRGEDGERRRGPGFAYYLIRIVLEIVLGVLASLVVAWFSRQREFRADRGAAQLLGQPDTMMRALGRLGQLDAGALPNSLAAMGIQGGIGRLFSTHPPIAERIDALRVR